MVTGATGLIGGEVVIALANAGRPVCALVRAASHAQARQRLFERLEKSSAFRRDLVHLIDAVSGDTAREMFGTTQWSPGGIGAVVHCAADTKFSESESVWHTNVAGARNLVALVRAVSPAARVVFVSTASVVTAPAGACLDEDAPYAGHANTYTRSKREAEAIVGVSRLDAVIVRPSIVLSRGVRDRAMARSILWAVQIMRELGDVPVDPDAHIDIVPVDWVACAILRLTEKPALKHRRYHVSAGRGSFSFTQLREEVIKHHPELRGVRPRGRNAQISHRALARLLRPLELYLPFINADVRYENDRLAEEIGASALPPSATAYLPGLIGQISLREAYEEMHQP